MFSKNLFKFNFFYTHFLQNQLSSILVLKLLKKPQAKPNKNSFGTTTNDSLCSLHFLVFSGMASTRSTTTTALGATSSGYLLFFFLYFSTLFSYSSSLFSLFTLGQVCLFPTKKKNPSKKINGFSERWKQAEPEKFTFFSLGIMNLYLLQRLGSFFFGVAFLDL